MKPTIANLFVRGVLLMVLCVGLSGCASNQVQTQGTITAVKDSGQTIEIKTDGGQSQAVLLTASTTLYNGDSTWRKTVKPDHIQPGQYLVVYQKMNPEGKLIADWGGVFSQRPTNLRGSEPQVSTPALTTTSPTSPAGSVLGPSFKAGETIPADKAVIYIYRPESPLFGADIKLAFPVEANGKPVTRLVQGGYAAYLTDPGQIAFTAFDTGFMAPSSVFSITVDAKAGQVYYLKGAHGKGMAGRAHLTLVDPVVGASEIAGCKLIP